MIEHKVFNVFLKANLILDPKVIYKDRHNIEYVRVPRETMSAYHFGGLPLFDAIRGVKIEEPVMNAQSHP